MARHGRNNQTWARLAIARTDFFVGVTGCVSRRALRDELCAYHGRTSAAMSALDEKVEGGSRNRRVDLVIPR